ncbi:MAG: DNA-3-methyladenine glycosylase [Nitrospirae bacterium]|nr:DNA-3-methyladenine glycosylase [Nitrospirota bacterium]
MAHSVLTRAYFRRPTVLVARSLLGKYLVRNGESGVLSGRIVEVEAYVGPRDRASHASRGRTKRTEVMFGPAGVAYVYLVYGMYHCFNVVTERIGYPAAILVRAVEIDSSAPTPLIDGPGRVCRVFQIDRSLDRLDLTLGQSLWLEDRGERVSDSKIAAFPRIGVDYAGKWAVKPWRFRLQRANG